MVFLSWCAASPLFVFEDMFTHKLTGDDNGSTLCSTGDVPNIFKGVAAYHSGPYDGVEMGCRLPSS